MSAARSFRRPTKAAVNAVIFLEWRDTPVSTRVGVTRDDGTEYETLTRSQVWELGDGTPVVLLEGRTGGIPVARLRRLP